jgi:hypothetical protein
MKPRGIDEARAAKEWLARELAGNPAVRGVGIAPRGDGYVVKLNLAADVASTVVVPEHINGVPVMLELVGEIQAR